MSYVVDVTHQPKWYVNAWMDAFYMSGARLTGDNSWNLFYPDYVFNWGAGPYGPNTVTFPDEQSYIMFLLRWS